MFTIISDLTDKHSTDNIIRLTIISQKFSSTYLFLARVPGVGNFL